MRRPRRAGDLTVLFFARGTVPCCAVLYRVSLLQAIMVRICRGKNTLGDLKQTKSVSSCCSNGIIRALRVSMNANLPEGRSHRPVQSAQSSSMQNNSAAQCIAVFCIDVRPHSFCAAPCSILLSAVTRQIASVALKCATLCCTVLFRSGAAEH